MKVFFFYLVLLFTRFSVIAQTDFTGIVKYRITVEQSSKPVTDSMMVIINKQKVEVILYVPRSRDSNIITERIFIDDFANKKSFALNAENKTYKTDSLNTGANYDFSNTNKIGAINNLLCFIYVADPAKLDTSSAVKADCLASIDYRNSFISNYFFLGIQPIIIDNRVVMDFTITQPDGTKPRVYVSDIKKVDNVDSYFNLAGYKKEQ